MRIILTLLTAFLIVGSSAVYAAVGCTLNDPDKDIKELFPTYTSYKSEFNSIEEHGGNKTKKEVERKLGDTLDTEYETIDVSYACYTVFKGKKKLGYVFGVNQKGIYGGIQIIIAADTSGTIKSWYFQKLSHPEADKLRAESFRKQFYGLNLSDFYFHREHYPETAAGCAMDGITNPLSDGKGDFQNTMRGMMKDLILFDIFKLDRAYD
ncbi:MAG: hypothetical protein GY771_12705 [bacterium]|nr:hypothetical protein [bacterium]